VIDINNMDLKGKKIFIRVDYNVPLSNSGEILDDTRIKRALSTVKLCSDMGAKVAIATHLGYPRGKVVKSLSTVLLRKNIEDNLKKNISFVDSCIGSSVIKAVESLKDCEVLLLENLRFYKGELDNDENFARELVDGYDIYINDGFSVSHRNHASVSAVRKFIKNRLPGLSLIKEASKLISVLSKSKSSVAVIGGGWKAVEKIDVVENLAKNMDFVLVGGALAQIFLIAKGFPLKASIEIPEEKIELAARIVKMYGNIILPEDSLALMGEGVEEIDNTELKEGMQLLDIGQKTIGKFKEILSNAKTIFWNGPLGKYEDVRFEKGTKNIAEFIANVNDVESIICGGDTIAAVNNFKLNEKYSYLSTAGGAALTLIAGKDMPGLKTVNMDGKK